MKQWLLLGLMFAVTTVFADNLTTQQAGQWLDSMQSLDSWSEAHPKEIELLRQRTQEQAKSHPKTKNMPSFVDSISAVKGTEVEPQLNALLSQHGFSNIDQWATVGDRVMAAYMELSMDGRDIKGDMEKQLQQIKNNPSIPQQQKQMLEQQMQQMLKMFENRRKASAEDVAAIKPIASRFDKMGKK